MNFTEVLGLDIIKKHLIHTVENNRISHAQLFISGEGAGGLPIAIAYAQRLFCTTALPHGNSCGICPNCYKMERLEHPDCHFVYPVNKSKKAKSTGRSDEKPTSDQFIHLWRELIIETKGYISEDQWYEYIGMENQQGNINKEEGNEILRKMSFKSVQGSYKIVIIWLPERMHEASANTLLKLIEEPAEKTVFLFVSQDPNRIITTIKSRTQQIIIPPLPANIIQEALEQQGFEDSAKIAAIANGNFSKALEMARNNCADEDLDRFTALMRKGFTAKYGELFDWAEDIAGIGREAQKRFCEHSISILRDCYLTSIDLEEITYTNPRAQKFVANFAPYVNHVTIEPFIGEFELLLNHIRQNGNPKILFADFALKTSKILAVTKQ